MTTRCEIPPRRACSSGPEARGRVLLRALIVVLAVGIGAGYADSLVPTGGTAPHFALGTLDGDTVRLADLKGRTVLLLFGELYNPNSVAACNDLAAVLARPTMGNVNASPFLIVTQQASAADLLAEAKRKGVTLTVLHDEGRRAFASYRVVVLPSLVVVDGEGMTVLSCVGYPLDFQDMVADAILHAVGKLSDREFARRRTGTTRPAVSEVQVRALRLAALGEQLARRGSEELAISNFQSALGENPGLTQTWLTLGNAQFASGQLGEAVST